MRIANYPKCPKQNKNNISLWILGIHITKEYAQEDCPITEKH